jgi:hypothetical protein
LITCHLGTPARRRSRDAAATPAGHGFRLSGNNPWRMSPELALFT